MAGRPKKPPQSVSELAYSVEKERASKLYSSSGSASVERIHSLTESAEEELRRSASAERISLSDVAAVRRVALDYLGTCSDLNVLPTQRGLCAALGCSSRAVNDHKRRHPNDPTTTFLNEFGELCAETLLNAALTNAVQPIVAIFALKSRYNWRDSLSLEVQDTAHGVLLEPERTAEEIASKYRELPPD